MTMFTLGAIRSPDARMLFSAGLIRCDDTTIEGYTHIKYTNNTYARRQSNTSGLTIQRVRT